MAKITDPYPVVIEFGPGSTRCATGGATGTGCAVTSTAQVMRRWGLDLPETRDGYPDMIALGRSMGSRHRNVDARVRHGLSLVYGRRCDGGYWCAYCAYLELEARGLPFRYGYLNLTEIRERLDNKHPIVMPGDGWQVPYVSPSTYSRTVPARGRGQVAFSTRPFPHMITAWESIWQGGRRTGYNISDPNFGSSRDRPIPPHCIYTDEVLERYWGALGWGVCYATEPPPPLTTDPAPTPPPVPPSKEVDVVFASASGYDVSSLPALPIPKGTRIADMTGKEWATIPADTSVRVAGLADANGKRRLVLVNTARYYDDGIKRPTWQVAVLK